MPTQKVKLTGTPPITDMPVGNLPEHQLAVITQHPTDLSKTRYVGRIVVRVKDRLITINALIGNSWSGLSMNPDFRARLLQPGECIEVTE